MGENIIKPLVELCTKTYQAHKLDILFGLGLSSIVAGYPACVKATVKAVRRVDLAEADKGEELTKKEIVQEVYPYYFEPLFLAAMGLGLIFKVDNAKSAEIIGLHSLYKVADDKLEKLEKAKDEVLSKAKKEQIEENVVKQTLDPYMADISVLPQAAGGHVLTYDDMTGMIFYSDQLTIKNAAVKFNEELLQDEIYKPYSDFYSLLNIDNNIEATKRLGFNLDRLLSIDIRSINVNGVPMLRIVHQRKPVIISDYGTF